ncbi:MAG: preprotein translocase subunit YajC [Pseudomonadota bacterium]
MDFLISTAHAQTEAAGQQNPLQFFLMMALLFVVFYFLLIRPQQKRQKQHQQMVAELSRGDEVMTAGGIVGRIASMSEQFVVVEIADGIEVKVQRQTISAVLPKGTVDAA